MILLCFIIVCEDIIYNFIICKGIIEICKDFFIVRRIEGYLKFVLINLKLLVGLILENIYIYSLNF